MPAANAPPRTARGRARAARRHGGGRGDAGKARAAAERHGEGAEQGGGGAKALLAPLRAAPLYAGMAGAALTVAHRLTDGLAPVADAASAQSRADVLCLVMSAGLALTGLSWRTTATRVPESEPPGGSALDAPWLGDGQTAAFTDEAVWLWDALAGANSTACALAVFETDGEARLRRVVHAGRAASGVDLGAPVQRPKLVQLAIDSEKGQYWANTALFPDAPSTLAALGLPPGTKGLLVQPAGDRRAVCVCADAVRGLSRVDQAWLATAADKLAG